MPRAPESALVKGARVIRLKDLGTPGIVCDVEGVTRLDQRGMREDVRVPVGSLGTVVSRDGIHPMVVWELSDGRYARTTPSAYKYRETWEVWHPGITPSTGIIVSEGVMDLYKAQSTEVINGVVPQVKYGDTIVWQGDPVPVENGVGEERTTDQQHEYAIKVAQNKITEVVKKQFQG